jgi:hypothetical protein
MDPIDPTEETRRAEQAEARATHGSDREPTDEEARIAESQEPVDESVARHFEEMNEIGANVEGEGRIEGSN